MRPLLGFMLFIHSFRYAARGVAVTFRRPRNAWLAALTAIVIGSAGFSLGISTTEWCLVVLAYAGVWAAESFNTALELLADSVTTELHPLIGHAKDAAAGAVLIATVGSIIIALLVFGPYLLALAGN